MGYLESIGGRGSLTGLPKKTPAIAIFYLLSLYLCGVQLWSMWNDMNHLDYPVGTVYVVLHGFAGEDTDVADIIPVFL